MIPLNDYLKGKIILSPWTIDGHIHIFSDEWNISEDELLKSRNVGFFDIEPKKIMIYDDIPGLYDKYISEHLREQDILCAAAVTPEDMIEIHRRHPDVIKGFGEIKAYSYISINDTPLSTLSLYDKVKYYARDHGLPIYIHYTIHDDRDAAVFEKWIEDAGTVILCHYGMETPGTGLSPNCVGDTNTNEKVYYIIRDMIYSYENLYTEVSWASLDFFTEHPNKLYGAGTDKLILGSDLNRVYFDEHESTAELSKKLEAAGSILHSDRVIKKIFNI